jgi:hypothetical protein
MIQGVGPIGPIESAHIGLLSYVGSHSCSPSSALWKNEGSCPPSLLSFVPFILTCLFLIIISSAEILFFLSPRHGDVQSLPRLFAINGCTRILPTIFLG